MPNLTAFIVMSLMCMISLIMGEPLQTLFGYDTCIAFYLVVLLHNCFIACGFVSSIYRLTCVKSKGQNISAKTLVICEYVFLLFAYIPGKFYQTIKKLDIIALCSRNFQNVKFRLDIVERSFYRHSDFT